MLASMDARLILLALAGCLFGGEALAQAERDGVSYDQDYFAPYTPRTALDMVERVPGFSINEGAERRGFTGAQGNVLIDGEPPTSKAQEIEDILARIPAANVIRVELVRGAQAGNAQSLYVNVVRRVGDGEGVWTLAAAHAENGRISPAAEAALSGRRGVVEYGVSATYESAYAPVAGQRFEYDENGGLEGRYVERLPADEREARVAGELAFPLGDWRVAFNVQLGHSAFDEVLNARIFDAGGTLDELISGDLAEVETTAEFGVLIRQERGDWQREFALIATRGRFTGEEASIERDVGAVFDEATYQSQRIHRGETILRAAFEREMPGGWRIDLGVEAARNTLEQRIALREDIGAGPVTVPLPSANVSVEEDRAEASIMFAGPLWAGWRFEGGASAEASVITQTGDTNGESEFAYLKPTLQLTRALDARNQLRFRLYRDVGQLDFEDFVSAADIQNAVINAGNPDLAPESSWRLEAAGDWRFGEDGALSITLYRWAIDDAIDLVPVGPPGARFDAPGNIGDATLTGARTELALPLPAGAELRLGATFQHTEATDPLTGGTRAISESEQRVLSASFRQDVGAVAWGLDYEQEIEAPSYRIDRVERERDAEELTLWIETSAFGGLKLRAWAENVIDSRELRRRRFFDPDRFGAFAGEDTRGRQQGLTLGISASGRF